MISYTDCCLLLLLLLLVFVLCVCVCVNDMLLISYAVRNLYVKNLGFWVWFRNVKHETKIFLK